MDFEQIVQQKNEGRVTTFDHVEEATAYGKHSLLCAGSGGNRKSRKMAVIGITDMWGCHLDEDGKTFLQCEIKIV